MLRFKQLEEKKKKAFIERGKGGASLQICILSKTTDE